MTNQTSPSKPRRARRWILGSLLLLALVIVAAIALGPWVASRLAPGIIESTAADNIQGTVKVDHVTLGWFTPADAGPIQLFDPQGTQIATIEIDTPITLWQVVAGRWWSSSALDLGTITLRGDLDLIRKPDGSTNLDAALAPRGPASTPSTSSSSGATRVPNIKARINVTQLDATIREEGADGKLGPELGVQKLSGPIDINIDQGALTAKADLSADVVSGNGAAASKAVIKLDVSAKQKVPGGPAGFSPENLERATVALDATGIPSAIIDALGGFGGALEEGLGVTSDTTLRIDGNLTAATIAMQFRSAGATAEAALKLADGVLIGTDPAKPALVLNITSTAFIAKLPQAASAIDQARQTLSLDDGPSFALTLDSLRIPAPASATSGQPLDPATIDFRNSGARITLDVGAMAGQVSLPAPSGKPDAPAAKENKPFAAQPLRIVIDATDLAKPVTISGATTTTLDGQSAGDLSVNASADGLLDSQGRLQALQAGAAPVGAIVADVTLKRFATALIQPFIAAMNLPVDLAQDAGPTVDIAMTARTQALPSDSPSSTTAAAGLAAIPTTNATVSLRSTNMNADVAARLESGTLRTTGEGIRVVINSAAPLARRVLAGDGSAPPPVMVDGTSSVTLTVTNLAVSLDALTSDTGSAAPLAAVDGTINLELQDLRATLAPSPATDTLPAVTAEPINVSRAAMVVVLARGQAPAVTLDAQATTAGANSPMSIAANLTADGLKSGALPAATGLDGLLALKLAGQVKAIAVPPALLAALPALAKYAPASTAQRTELDTAIAHAIAAAVGTGADATINLGQPQGGGTGQVVRIQLATQAQGAGTDLYLRLSPTEAAITGGTTFLVAEPASINAILAAASVPAPAAPAPSATDPAAEPVTAAIPARPITLDSRTKLWLRMPEAIVVPLKKSADGALEPDFARAKDFFATLAAEGEITVGGIPIGSEPGATEDAPPTPTYTSARLGKLEAQVRVPMAALADDAARALPANRASLKLTTDARTGEGAPVAAVAIDAQAGLDASSPEALVTLAGINTANVDALLNRQGFVTGAMGNTADIALRVTPEAGSATNLNLTAEITSPTISGATLSLARRADVIALTGPSNITWTPAPAFLNSILVTDDNSVRVTRTSAVTVNLTKLALATGPEGSGLFLPTVFDLDAQIATPQLAMDLPSPADARGVRAPARAIEMNGIAARTRWDPAAPAIRQAAPGALSAAVTIDGISGNEGPAAKPSKITLTLRAFIDPQGNIISENAVVNADADLSMFPTILIDQLANQGGLMNEVLGPTVSASATLRNVSQARTGPRGTLEANLTSPRATARIKGEMRRGQFVQNGPTQVRLLVIRPELMEALGGSLPLVATMEKTTSDEPAMVEASDLSVPLDKDLSKLNGVIGVDLGVARFTTNSILGSLLKAVGGRDSGAIGRKVEPFVVRIVNGVATYDRFRLPLGEFSIETRGSVDLVSRKVNLVAYVPFFALTDEAMGPIRLGLGGRLDILDRTTMVPITIKGDMNNPGAMIDVPMFLQETGSNLIKTPGRIIEGIGDLLGGNRNQQSPKPDDK